jgi:hypothetical protein
MGASWLKVLRRFRRAELPSLFEAVGRTTIASMSLRRGSNSLRIVVLGYVVRAPLAGLAWHYLQYVLGLVRLGHEVLFVEDSDDYPSCYNPQTLAFGNDPGYGLQFLSDSLTALDLPARWAYYDAHLKTWHGPGAARVHETLKSADLCLNVSGVNPLRPWFMEIPVRALIDTDPAFTQIRHLENTDSLARAERHTVFFTFGEEISAGRALVPDDGLPWQPTRQPILLTAWPVTPGHTEGRFTSVLIWEAYPALEYNGRRYGAKSDSFTQFLALPAKTGPIFELAFGSRTAPGRLVSDHGWTLVNPLPISRTLDTYRRFLQASKAEFSIAKHGYVVSRSGWFSERSAAYLASGRPVVAQDTGFSHWLPTGEGVVPFVTLDEAASAIASVNGRYENHCRAARGLAEAFFDSDTVLAHLVERAMSDAPRWT